MESFKITEIKVLRRKLNLVKQAETNHGVNYPTEKIILKIKDESGIEIKTECSALESGLYDSETIDITEENIKNKIIPLVIDEEFESPQELNNLLVESYPETPIARASIEIFGWLIIAKKNKISLKELIGGVSPKIPAGLVTTPGLNASETAKEVLWAEKKGYQRAKIKVSRNNYLEVLNRVRDKCPDYPIWIDANEDFHGIDIAQLKEIDKFELVMIEQPFKKKDWKKYSVLCRDIKTLVCHDESIQSLEDVIDMNRNRAGDIVCLKPSRVGGITESLRIHDYCLEAGIPLWIGGMYETNIGKEITTTLDTLPGVRLPGDMMKSGTLYKENVEWKLVDGYIERN